MESTNFTLFNFEYYEGKFGCGWYFILLYIETDIDSNTGTKTRGQHLGSRVCPFLLAIAKPCDPTNCNHQCFQQLGGKPAPGSIKGPLLGGNCLAENCYCSFCCDVRCN